MQSNFSIAAEFTASEEGLYQCSRADAGNWTSGIVGMGNCVGTMRGISAPVMVRWVGDASLVTRSMMQGIDEATFSAIARALYWRALDCDGLLSGVDLMLFDFGFNSGISRAARMLQQIAGLSGADLDGDIGPQTLQAVAGAPLATICAAIDADHARALQKMLHVTADGEIGRVTLAALADYPDGRALALALALATRQALAYRSFSQFRVFGAGWMARLARRLDAAVRLIDEAPAVAA